MHKALKKVCVFLFFPFYKADLVNGGLINIVNIGAPFSSVQDDSSSIISVEGDEGYFVRQGNIFQVDLSNRTASIKP